MAEDTSRQSLIKNTSWYAFASYIAQGIGIINSFALRRFLGPESMGIWSVIQVLLGYCGQASIGTTQALARDYPFLKGKGEMAQAETVKNVTTTFTMSASILPAIVLLVAFFWKGQSWSLEFRVGILFLSAFLFLQRFYDIVITLLRSDKHFRLLSLLTVVNAIGMLAVSMMLVSFMNIYGMYLGTALVTTGCLILIYKRRPYKFNWTLDKKELMNALKLGIPLAATSFLFTFLMGLDRLLIAKYIGFYGAGLYSIAIMVNSYVSSLPTMFAHVWYPHLQEAYGRDQDSLKIRHYLETPLYALSILIPLLSSAAIFIIPVLVGLFIPRFEGGLGAMSYFLIGSYFVIMGQLSGNFLVTINRYLVIIPILAVTIGIHFSINTFFLRHDMGVTGVAIGSSMAFSVYGISSYLFCLRQLDWCPRAWANFACLLWHPAFLFGSAFFLQNKIDVGNVFLSLILKCVLMLILSAYFLWLLEKKTGLTQTVVEMLKAKLLKRKSGAAS